MKDLDIQFLYIDLFCGAGGTSTGVDKARVYDQSCARVIACVNHDANAIASHAANHPEALHFTEDIRILDLTELYKCIKLNKIQYTKAKVVLWASLECTNFSKAKGGQPRDADSRTLAEHLLRYIYMLEPDYIQIENVEEFMSWGDLDENGKPISKTNGKQYHKWISDVKNYGYEYDFRILNAADYGAYTSRKRFFGIFAKDNLPIVFPKPTHCKGGSRDLFSNLKQWKPVKECLDFSDEGESIFDRKKDLVEASLDRIMSGLIKFVAGGKDKWLLKYNSVNKETRKHNPPGIDEPCPTVSCQGRLGLIQTTFLSKYYSGHPESKNISIEEPAHTVTARDHHSLIQANFLSKYYSGNPDQMNYSVEQPAATLRTKDSQSLISTCFLSSYYGNGSVHSVEAPSPTVTTKDRLSFIHPDFIPKHFIDQQFGQSKAASVDKPLGALTANPKYNLVQCDKWIMNTNFGNVGSSIEEPSPVITANRKWHYLMNPQFKSKGSSVEHPCFTLIARMDKAPPYLVEISNESHHIPSFIKIIDNTVIYEIYEEDSPKTKEIKEFMALYGILDIKMRMLRIPELKMIMGFPKDYILLGTQADQKKFIGNAVEVNMARCMCEALAYKLLELAEAV